MLPKVQVEVIGSKQKVMVEALLDTGFAGYVCLPVTTAEKLGLELTGSVVVELANGQLVKNLVFAGQVRFSGSTQHVDVIVGDSETPQVGVLLLSDCRVSIDFPTNKVRITRKN